jgi:hypothetical protein
MIATTISLADRDRLSAGQYLILATTGHHNESLCYVQVGSPFARPADWLCQQYATHRVQRLDYALGVTTPTGFTPGVVFSQVCAEHAAIVADEPGLLDITEIRGAR